MKEVFLKTLDNEINFFPSATLAAAYFENLIAPTCKYIIENNGFYFNDIKYAKVKIKVIMPERITSDLNVKFEKLKAKFSTSNVSFHYAGRPRNITMDMHIKDNTLTFVDFPTIISGINFAIANLLPDEFHQFNSEYNLIVERELERFITTLNQLLLRNYFDDMAIVVRESQI